MVNNYLDLLEQVVAGHLWHPVVCDDHAHIGLLDIYSIQKIKAMFSSQLNEKSKARHANGIERQREREKSRYRAQNLQRPLPAVNRGDCIYQQKVAKLLNVECLLAMCTLLVLFLVRENQTKNHLCNLDA